MGAGEDAATEAAHEADAGGGGVVEVPPGRRRWRWVAGPRSGGGGARGGGIGVGRVVGSHRTAGGIDPVALFSHKRSCQIKNDVNTFLFFFRCIFFIFLFLFFGRLFG